MTRGFRDEDDARRRRDDDDTRHEPVTFEEVQALHASPHALKVLIAGKSHWIPQSQITDDSEVYAIGHHGKLVITGWFARKEGLA